MDKTQSVLMLQRIVNTVNTVLSMSNTLNTSSYDLQNRGRPAFLTTSCVMLTASFVEISPFRSLTVESKKHTHTHTFSMLISWTYFPPEGRKIF